MWDINPYSVLKLSRRFGGTYRSPPLRSNNKPCKETSMKQISGRADVSQKSLLTLNGMHGVSFHSS